MPFADHEQLLAVIDDNPADADVMRRVGGYEGTFHQALAAVRKKLPPGMTTTWSLNERIRKDLQGVVDRPRKIVDDLRNNVKDQLDHSLAAAEKKGKTCKKWHSVPKELVDRRQ